MSEYFDFDAYERDTENTSLPQQSSVTPSDPSPLLSAPPSEDDMDVDMGPAAPSFIDETQGLGSSHDMEASSDLNSPSNNDGNHASGGGIAESNGKRNVTDNEVHVEDDINHNVSSPVLPDARNPESPTPQEEVANPDVDNLSKDDDSRAKDAAEDTIASPVETTAQLPKYEVHRILDSVIIEGLLYYRAAWRGWGRPDKWYYAARGFQTCPNRLISYHKRNPNKPGPPKRLEVWKEAWDRGEVLEEHDDDDVPAEK